MGIISFLIKKTKTYKDLKERLVALEDERIKLINQQDILEKENKLLKKERESFLIFSSKEPANCSFRFFLFNKDKTGRIIFSEICFENIIGASFFWSYITCYDVNHNPLAEISFKIIYNKENKSYYFYIVDVVNKGEENKNKGLGTILLTQLKSIAKFFNCTHIEGWISPVDYNHIDRLKRFYEKNEFELFENEKENQIDIKWKNKSYSKYNLFNSSS
ncbi:MAG: hypothetical protein WHS77_10765 [Brevinematales bacterium]